MNNSIAFAEEFKNATLAEKMEVINIATDLFGLEYGRRLWAQAGMPVPKEIIKKTTEGSKS